MSLGVGGSIDIGVAHKKREIIPRKEKLKLYLLNLNISVTRWKRSENIKKKKKMIIKVRENSKKKIKSTIRNTKRSKNNEH